MRYDSPHFCSYVQAKQSDSPLVAIFVQPHEHHEQKSRELTLQPPNWFCEFRLEFLMKRRREVSTLKILDRHE